jgi:hypothetical protein
MRKIFLRIILCAVLVPVMGCDIDKMNRLEKQNEELKAEIKKKDTMTDYDLQAKCSRDAKSWFNENWASSRNEKQTILLDFTNHYNKASNKCFILVEYHYSMDKNGSWTNDMTLWDVYENSKYANFGKNTMIYFKPQYHSEESVFMCDVLDAKCKTIDQFNDLVRPYMNN